MLAGIMREKLVGLCWARAFFGETITFYKSSKNQLTRAKKYRYKKLSSIGCPRYVLRIYSTPDISFHFSIITSNIQATVIQPALHLGRYRHPSTLWAACRSGLLDFDFGGGCFNGIPTPIHFVHFASIFPCQTLRMYTLKLPRKNRTQ